MQYPTCPNCGKDTLLSPPFFHGGKRRWFSHYAFFLLWFKLCRIQYLPHMHYHCGWCRSWHSRVVSSVGEHARI